MQEFWPPTRGITHPDQLPLGYINSGVPAGESHSWWDYSDFLDLSDACRKIVILNDRKGRFPRKRRGRGGKEWNWVDQHCLRQPSLLMQVQTLTNSSLAPRRTGEKPAVPILWVLLVKLSVLKDSPLCEPDMKQPSSLKE